MALSKAPFNLPLNSDGFIDHKSIYKIIHGELRQPFGVLDEMTVRDVAWMLEGSIDNKKDYFEMVSYSVKVAMASIYQGRDIRLFDEDNQENIEVTEESRAEDLSYLEDKFGSL